MISHHNVISNVMQITAFDGPFRNTMRDPMQKHYTENTLALLPMSHIYALVVMCHMGPYRGDGSIVLPRFEMQMLLNSIQKNKISTLYLVPPIVILIAKNKPILDKFDLSSVRVLFTGRRTAGQGDCRRPRCAVPALAHSPGLRPDRDVNRRQHDVRA